MCRPRAPISSALLTSSQTYANRVVPEARGRVAQITQAAEAYKSQTVAEATGQTSRFLKIYEQYKKAPDVTRERMYLETMERVLGGTDKIILDSRVSGSGVVPYLPLNELLVHRKRAGNRRREAGNETEFSRRHPRSSWRSRADRRLLVFVHRVSDAAGAGGPRTSLVAPHMSAFGGRPDIGISATYRHLTSHHSEREKRMPLGGHPNFGEKECTRFG